MRNDDSLYVYYVRLAISLLSHIVSCDYVLIDLVLRSILSYRQCNSIHNIHYDWKHRSTTFVSRCVFNAQNITICWLGIEEKKGIMAGIQGTRTIMSRLLVLFHIFFFLYLLR